MTIEAFRVQNFMCFKDSGWVELRPLTLLYGRNSVGKSALLRALLLLRQSLGSQPDEGPLVFTADDGFDFGSYQLMVRDHNMSRSIEFWFSCAFEQEQGALFPRTIIGEKGGGVAAVRGLGVEGSSIQVRLSYRFANQKVGLHSVALYDQQEQLIWRALKNGHSWHFEADFFSEQSANIWSHTAVVVEEGFFPRLHPASPELVPIQQVLCHIERSVSDFFSNLHYVGPMRAEAQRVYHLSNQTNGHATNGQRLVDALLSSDSGQPSAMESINEWLATSGLRVRLQVNPLDETPSRYELLLSNPWTRRVPPFQANIREVGFGISQVLPVVVETLLAPENSTLLLEHPGQHLHPSVHAQLGDLFIRVAVRKKVRLLIESHSETLMIRMRRRVGESSLGYLLPEEHAYLPYEAVRFYFLNREHRQSEVKRLGINQEGDLSLRPQGFSGFFADDLRETVALVKAQLGR